jgi:twitching motility protein PilT
MARIDRLIEALVQRGADRLLLQSDEKACLDFGGDLRTITASALHSRLLTIFLREVLPDELAEDFGQEGEHRFVYDSPSGPIAVVVTRTGKELSAEAIVHAAEAEPAEEVAAKPSREAVKQAAPAPPSLFDAEHAPAPSAQSEPVPEPAGVRHRTGATASDPRGAIDDLFREMVREGCSDLHISSANPPLFRKDGAMTTLSQSEMLPPRRAQEMLYAITPAARRKEFEERNDSDFSYEIPGVGRFRCNLFMDRKGIGGVFRIIPTDILKAEALGLSAHILGLCNLSKGLVVVTGPTGSGKSTTLAAMVDHINCNRSAHLITIEDPIEFVHENKKCLINQREIGNHTLGFKPALRAALREDPDIVLVGEMRDLETVEIAIETAETGHLVFGTLHTNTAASTIDRIIDQFPSDRQGQIRTMLSNSLRGVIAQTLCKKIGGGRVAALEVLIVNSAVSNLIREGKTFQIPSVMQTGRKLGMVTLNEALVALVQNGQVEPEEACAKAVEPGELAKLLAARDIKVDPSVVS